jgi:diadenosine tetraphosphatase ApaH/serine/threonine PP2A family protein phosphatase
MMIDGLSEYGNVNHWLVNGGGWFFNLDYDKEVLAKALVHKAAELPLIIELVTAERKIVICHADYPHNEYAFDKPVPKEMVIWNRERVSDAQDGIVSPIAGADLFIFGHTPAPAPEVCQPDVHRYRCRVLRKPHTGTGSRWCPCVNHPAVSAKYAVNTSCRNSTTSGSAGAARSTAQSSRWKNAKRRR